MRTKVLLLLVTAMTLIGLLNPALASAHVLITDTTHKLGFVYHVTPDDDPVAGQPSVLYFSLQNNDLKPSQYLATVSLTDDAGYTDKALMSYNGQTFYAGYTFPHTGVYQLEIHMDSLAPAAAKSKAVSYDLKYSQRVSRGLSNGAPSASTGSSSTAGAATVLTLSAFICFEIIFFDRRRAANRAIMNQVKHMHRTNTEGTHVKTQKNR